MDSWSRIISHGFASIWLEASRGGLHPIVIGLIGLIMACYDGYRGILTGLTKSTDHPSSAVLSWACHGLLLRDSNLQPNREPRSRLFNFPVMTQLIPCPEAADQLPCPSTQNLRRLRMGSV